LLVKTIIPLAKANILVRVYGNQKSTRAALGAFAVQIAVDRFPGNFPVAGYLTEHLNNREAPWVEFRGEFFASLKPTVFAVFNPYNFSAMMNLKDNINPVDPAINVNLQPPIINFTSDVPANVNPSQLTRGNTAGNYIGAMAVQVFSAAGQPPVLPPINLPTIQLSVL
jgi:hypothetical protein